MLNWENTSTQKINSDLSDNSYDDSMISNNSGDLSSHQNVELHSEDNLRRVKVEDKRITVLVSEIIAVQIYEKTSSSTSKRPGFSLQN